MKNLRAMHWRNNRNKADDFPDYESVVTSGKNASGEDTNVEKEEKRMVHESTLRILKDLYPTNPHLQGVN
jgi:hypothetical protein